MNITRIYTGSDGESHFEDVDVAVEDAGEIGKLSACLPTTGIIFRENDPGYDYGWHTAPQRQYVIMLSGEIEIEVGDGTKRRLGAGDILLAEDTTGRGHRSKSVDGKPRRSIFVTLD